LVFVAPRGVNVITEQFGVSGAAVHVAGHQPVRWFAASIPPALHQLRADRRLKSDDLTLLLGFGAGLTYAAQVVRL
jgi:3-oxoacyl-[acyl-carrier-protein] synthase III